MSQAPSDSAPAPDAMTPPTVRTTIDLAQLDDKRLGRYRHPNERWALIAIAIGAVVLVGLLWLARPFIGSVLAFLPGPLIEIVSRWIHPTRIVPLVIILVALAVVMDVVAQSSRAWQLVAQAVEVTPTTFPQFAPIVDELRHRFDLPKTRVFVSRSAPPTGYTIGVRQPYAIVFSAITVGSQTADEFKFMLGREMGHIKLGHQVTATLFGSANMQLPQPFSFVLKIRSVLFGSYQQAQELSCDRMGVVATRDVRPALTALVKQNLGSVRGAKIDHTSLAPQQAELRHGLSAQLLKVSQVMSSQPFPISRLAELTAWAGDPPETPEPAPDATGSKRSGASSKSATRAEKRAEPAAAAPETPAAPQVAPTAAPATQPGPQPESASAPLSPAPVQTSPGGASSGAPTPSPSADEQPSVALIEAAPPAALRTQS